jgi:hypothetical protein
MFTILVLKDVLLRCEGTPVEWSQHDRVSYVLTTTVVSIDRVSSFRPLATIHLAHKITNYCSLAQSFNMIRRVQAESVTTYCQVIMACRPGFPNSKFARVQIAKYQSLIVD